MRAPGLPLLLLVAMPLAAEAKPPVVPGYARMDDLENDLASAAQRMREEEEFAAKPFAERLILRFQAGATSYEDVKRLDGEDLVEQILEKWKEAQAEEVDKEVIRILALLPEALKARYDVNPIPKRERFKASKLLVEALVHRYTPIRQAAIDCLKALYGQTRLYQPDLPLKRRMDIKKDWQKLIEKLAK